MAISSPAPIGARFDRFSVDLSSGELFRSGVRVPIQVQPFQVLRLLLEAQLLPATNCVRLCGQKTPSLILSLV